MTGPRIKRFRKLVERFLIIQFDSVDSRVYRSDFNIGLLESLIVFGEAITIDNTVTYPLKAIKSPVSSWNCSCRPW